MHWLLFTFVCVFTFRTASSQELDSLLQTNRQRIPVTGSFKSSRVINGHSMEMLGKRVLDFRILHRFGEVSQGLNELFGLDQASMRMGFDYGLGNNMTLGIGRSTFNKELDGFAKFRLLVQKTNGGSPFSLIGIAGITFNATSNSSLLTKLSATERVAYYYQLIAGRKFNDRFSLQVTPTLVHRNVVAVSDNNDIYALGLGARFKLSRRLALVGDYFYIFNGVPGTVGENPLSIGFDIETGGHVFQLHFTNAVGMNERAFITETIANWARGDIRFGFNLSRVFTLGD